MSTLPSQIAQEFKKSIDRMIGGKVNLASERARMMGFIESSGYQPEEGTEGTLEDLGSYERINLILNSNVEMIRSRRQFVDGCSEGALEAFPAMELISVMDCDEPCNWEEIWNEAIEKLGGTTTATDAFTGRMVALKADPIWSAISDFGQPHPPFKLNSGMGLEDVDYEDAVDLELMGKDDSVPMPTRLSGEIPLVGFDLY